MAQNHLVPGAALSHPRHRYVRPVVQDHRPPRAHGDEARQVAAPRSRRQGARRASSGLSRALYPLDASSGIRATRARDRGVSVAHARAHGAKVSCRLAYLHETAAKGSRGDAGALDMFKISPARDTLGKIFSSAIRGLTDANDSRDNHRLVRPSTRPTAVR